MFYNKWKKTVALVELSMTNQQNRLGGVRYDSRGAPVHTLGHYATSLLHAVTKGVERETQAYNLTPLDFAIVRLFLTDREWTATELAQILPVEVSAISRIVSKLVDRGFLYRRRPKSDRRVVILKLTEEGKQKGLDLHARVHAYEERLVERYPRR